MDRLPEVGHEAGAPHVVLVVVPARYRNDRRRLWLLKSDLLEEPARIVVGEVHVADDHVRSDLAHDVEGGFRGTGGRDERAGIGQQGPENVARVVVVLDDQDVNASEITERRHAHGSKYRRALTRAPPSVARER
jgi:hypothetical protein